MYCITTAVVTPPETNVDTDALFFKVKTWPRHKTTEALLNNGWQVAVGGWRRLAVGVARVRVWRLVVVGGGWRLVVPGGCPQGLSLTKKIGLLKDTPGVDASAVGPGLYVHIAFHSTRALPVPPPPSASPSRCSPCARSYGSDDDAFEVVADQSEGEYEETEEDASASAEPSDADDPDDRFTYEGIVNRFVRH